VFYVIGGFLAMLRQTMMTFVHGTAV